MKEKASEKNHEKMTEPAKPKNGIYLNSLTLINFATFQNQKILYDQKFNAIIGETGAGKSLIVDAMQLILGQRGTKKLIRKNAPFASVEAVFIVQDREIEEYFAREGYPFENHEVVIKRVFYPSGANKAFLNFSACGLNTLIKFSRQFVDLVGQFENQKLLSEVYQLLLLDTYARALPLRQKYKKEFDQYQQALKRREELLAQRESKTQKRDFLLYQIKEIETLSPSVEEEEKLIQQKEFVQTREKKAILFSQILSLLSEGEGGSNALSLLQMAHSLAHSSSSLFSPALLDQLAEARVLVEDLSFNLSQEKETDENLEIPLEEVLERLDHYQRLKRKYGQNIEGILLQLENFRQELETLESVDQEIEDLQVQLKHQQKNLQSLATELHALRMVAANKLSSALTQNVRKLKMQNATIRIDLEKASLLGPTGQSQVVFLAETNLGEGYFKIKEIASGGELSRILLALRQILATNDSISIFLFDEIDTGIGGETALSIGQALAEVAANSQVIAITHLPQIAHFAEKLIVVSKNTTEEEGPKRTFSIIKEVTGKSKEKEIQAMVPLL